MSFFTNRKYVLVAATLEAILFLAPPVAAKDDASPIPGEDDADQEQARRPPAGYESGFYILSADEKFSLSVSGFLRP